MSLKRRSFIATAILLATFGRMSSIFAAEPPMTEKNFWRLVEAAKKEAGNNWEARPDVLQRRLSTLTPEEIQAFQQRYEILLLKANSWALWGAAYIMNGGCSDDGFQYFRDWLISEGEGRFKTALTAPDSLASVPRQEYFELEALGYAASKAYAAKGAGELESDFSLGETVTKGRKWHLSELPQLYPALAAKYLKK